MREHIFKAPEVEKINDFITPKVEVNGPVRRCNCLFEQQSALQKR